MSEAVKTVGLSFCVFTQRVIGDSSRSGKVLNLRKQNFEIYDSNLNLYGVR